MDARWHEGQLCSHGFGHEVIVKTPRGQMETISGTATQGEAWEGEIYDGVGSTYGSEPAAFLRAAADELLLSGCRGEFRLGREDIWKIGHGDFYPWLFCAIQIHHHITSYPNEIQFKPARVSPHAVLARLRSLGYPVQ